VFRSCGLSELIYVIVVAWVMTLVVVMGRGFWPCKAKVVVETAVENADRDVLAKVSRNDQDTSATVTLHRVQHW
jgi:hypothetical protein